MPNDQRKQCFLFIVCAPDGGQYAMPPGAASGEKQMDGAAPANGTGAMPPPQTQHK